MCLICDRGTLKLSLYRQSSDGFAINQIPSILTSCTTGMPSRRSDGGRVELSGQIFFDLFLFIFSPDPFAKVSSTCRRATSEGLSAR